jgi:hypothetical protein
MNKPAWTRIHGRGQHEASGKHQGHGGAGDRDCTVLEGLAKNFENVAGKLGEFVEKEQTIVRERDFAGPRDRAAANQSGIGDGVVRRAIRAPADQAAAGIKNSGDTVNLRRLQGFFKRERRQNRGHALGEHGFAGTGRPNHQYVVASGTGNFDGTLGGLLAANVFEVNEEFLIFAQEGVAVSLERSDAVAGVHKVDDVKQRFHRVNVDAADHGGFAGIRLRNDESGDFAAAGFEGDWQSAANPAEAAIQREFANEETVGDVLLGEAAIGPDDSERHGQIEAGALFLNVGRGEVNSDVGRWNVVATILEGGADPVAAFAHGGVGQTDGVKVILVGLDTGAVHLDLNNVGIDAIDRGAESLIEQSILRNLRAGTGTRGPEPGISTLGGVVGRRSDRCHWVGLWRKDREFLFGLSH